MKDLKKTKQLVRTIINFHEVNDYESLLAYVSEEEITKGTWFTHKRFMEVCEAIKTEIGSITSLEYIGTLKRKTSYLTLWKTTYNKSHDEVLWQIIFDTQNNRIKLMHINWEQIS